MSVQQKIKQLRQQISATEREMDEVRTWPKSGVRTVRFTMLKDQKAGLVVTLKLWMEREQQP